tara:strand:+ start:28212 stop:29057 length:846 start_codon:yes stop_codon:yes gene_type:complete
MLGTHFYNESIKTSVAIFGSLFNNIVIKRRDGKMLPVPISYGPRQKWLDAQKVFKPSEEMFEKLLPRMSYEIVAMNYDSSRKLTNKQTMLRTPDGLKDPRQRINVPVPYNLDFTMNVTAKTLNDGWQILEQILPFFTPAYTVKVRHFPEDQSPLTPTPTNTFDQTFALLAVMWADDYTGDLGDRRFVEWTLEFQTKIWMHGPVAATTVIYDARAIVSVPPSGVPISKMNRASSQDGIETGYAQQVDSETIFNNDSDRSPTILNLSDSDGNIIKIIRDLPNK